MFQIKAKLNNSVVDVLDQKCSRIRKKECNQATVITELKRWRKSSSSLEKQHWQILYGGQQITKKISWGKNYSMHI